MRIKLSKEAADALATTWAIAGGNPLDGEPYITDPEVIKAVQKMMQPGETFDQAVIRIAHLARPRSQ